MISITVSTIIIIRRETESDLDDFSELFITDYKLS